MNLTPSPAPIRTSLRLLVSAGVTRRKRDSSQGAGLAVLVAALVFGILGMHALASYCGPAAAASPNSTAMTGMKSAHEAAMASSASHAAHAHTATASAPTPAASSGGGGSSHNMASVVMLCAVMLAAGALTLLALLAVGILRPLLPTAFAPAPVRERTLQRVRGTGPPPAWQFSVIRC